MFDEMRISFDHDQRFGFSSHHEIIVVPFVPILPFILRITDNKFVVNSCNDEQKFGKKMEAAKTHAKFVLRVREVWSSVSFLRFFYEIQWV